MARLFDDGSSQYLSVASAPVTAVPLTLAAWFNTNDLETHQVILAIADTDGGSTNYHYIRFHHNSDRVAASTYDGTTAGTAYSSTTLTANTWRHACGVFTASDDRAAFLDGGGKGDNSTDVTPVSIDATYIGATIAGGTVQAFMSGMIAEAAIWNVALSDEEVAVLAEGYPPPLVRPGNLVLYLPLDDTDREWNDRYNMTPVNGPSWAVHPPKVLRMRQRLWPYPVASMGSNKIWAGF